MGLVLGISKPGEYIKIGEDIFIYPRARNGKSQVVVRIEAPKDVIITRHILDSEIPKREK